jgi:hypothetical protein
MKNVISDPAPSEPMSEAYKESCADALLWLPTNLGRKPSTRLALLANTSPIHFPGKSLIVSGLFVNVVFRILWRKILSADSSKADGPLLVDMAPIADITKAAWSRIWVTGVLRTAGKVRHPASESLPIIAVAVFQQSKKLLDLPAVLDASKKIFIRLGT